MAGYEKAKVNWAQCYNIENSDETNEKILLIRNSLMPNVYILVKKIWTFGIQSKQFLHICVILFGKFCHVSRITLCSFLKFINIFLQICSITSSYFKKIPKAADYIPGMGANYINV